jgi:hypothetical protein
LQALAFLQSQGDCKQRVRAVAVLHQYFAADAAMAGDSQPIVVDKEDATAMRQMHCVDNMDAINGIICAMLEAKKLIGKAICVRTTAAPPPLAGVAASADIGIHIHSLYKHLKKTKEKDMRDSVRCYERLILALEKKDEEETEARLFL